MTEYVPNENRIELGDNAALILKLTTVYCTKGETHQPYHCPTTAPLPN